MSKRFRHICGFLKGNEGVASCLAAIERNAALLREIRSKLPPPLDSHCLHASLDNGLLTLLTDSPVWASRLRFFSPELERSLKPRHPTIAACRIRIRPQASASSSNPRSHPGNRLPEKTTRHLKDAAASVADAELAAALRRLAEAGAKAR